MRITAGRFKGQRLSVPKGQSVRPTSSRVREAIFSIVGSVEGCAILDLCAGAGTLGLESLSRGAKSVTFVDSSETSLRNLKKNLVGLEVLKTCTVLKGKAQQHARRLGEAGAKFDIIFIDPPYGTGVLKESLEALADFEMLESRGVIMAECDQDDEALTEIVGAAGILEQVDSRRYGRTIISFLQWRQSQENAPTPDLP